MKITESRNPRWQVEYRQHQATIVLPYEFDTSNLIEVTRVGDQFARFVYRDRVGEVDCAVFAQWMREEMA